MPYVLVGADVLISSETGTGKTGALALPTMQIIYESLRGEANTHLSRASGNQPLITKDGKPNIRLSTVDRETAVAIDNEGLLVQSRDGNWMGVRTLVGVAGRAQVGNVRKIQTDHKWYFEMYPTDDGLSRVGVSTGTATLALGTDKQSWGCGGTGMASHDGNFVKAGLPFKNKDVVGIALDLNPSPSGLGTLSLTVNGSPLEVIHSNLPLDTPLYPAVYLKNAEVKFSFSGPFKHLVRSHLPIFPFLLSCTCRFAVLHIELIVYFAILQQLTALFHYIIECISLPVYQYSHKAIVLLQTAMSITLMLFRLLPPLPPHPRQLNQNLRVRMMESIMPPTIRWP